MPSAACAFPQRLATHLDAAYGPGAVKVAVRAMSGSGSGTASKNGHIIDAAATTDLLILDYAINDAIVATAKTYDVDDAGAHVAVLCTFYVPLSPASWTHWLASGARGHAARDGSPTFTFVACATEDELRRANRLHYAYQDIVAPVARRYGASLDPHPTYEDHQLIADVLWYHWLQHAAMAHCARDDDGADGPAEPEPEPEAPEEAAPADPCGEVLASFVAEGSDAEFPAARRGRDWRYYEDRPAKPGWIGQARERSKRRELGPVSASRDEFREPSTGKTTDRRRGDEFRELSARKTMTPTLRSAQVRVSPPRAPGAAPAVDVDDGAVTSSTRPGTAASRPTRPSTSPRRRRAAARAPRATSSSACCPDASRKLKFKLVGLEACAGLVNATT
ncbi:hypothetical protein JL722_15060 [Aureococcus anophagefferens]|nr:hypothetical protein JL722_15060 [Aureococcus anophagefferens]